MRDVRLSKRAMAAVWRVQADELKGAKGYGARHNYDSDQEPNTEIDEIVIGRWFHLEAMDTRLYWMDIGGLVVNVELNPDGTPKRVIWEEEQLPGVDYGDGDR